MYLCKYQCYVVFVGMEWVDTGLGGCSKKPPEVVWISEAASQGRYFVRIQSTNHETGEWLGGTHSIEH